MSSNDVLDHAQAHHMPEYRRPEDMEWEMGRFKNKTKFLFHTRAERPTEPNAGFCAMNRARASVCTSMTSPRSGT